jgi:hypothetical protein
MAWAILTTLFCCLPLGIVSIVYAAQVDGKRAAGDIAGARLAADKARFWAIASAISVFVLVALWLLLFGGLAMLAALSAQH